MSGGPDSPSTRLRASGPPGDDREGLSGGPRRHPQLDQFKRTWYFLRKNSLAMVGLGLITFFVIVALGSFFYPAPDNRMILYCGTSGGGATNCAPICTYSPPAPAPSPNCYPVSPLTIGLVAPTITLSPLSLGPLPLGSLAPNPSNPYFYNILAGLIKGAPWSLGISIAIVGTGALVGLFLGAFSGLKGGYIDETIMRFTDIFLSIPGLLLVLVLLAVLSTVLGNSLTFLGRIGVLVGAFVVTWWPFYTRIVRGQVLVTREQSYVEAARASGAGNSRLLFRHIIPNSMYPVFVQMSLDVGTIPLLLGVIVYLGFSIWPSTPFPEWGTLSAISVKNVESLVVGCATSGATLCVFPWWQILFPGLTVFLFAISVNFLSDGIRDALDPRLRR
jgi:peptide/nickel transport system permease protein